MKTAAPVQGHSPRGQLLFAVVVCAALAVVLLLLINRDSDASRNAVFVDPIADYSLPRSTVPDLPRQSPEVLPPPSDTGQFLADYWGSQWPAAEAGLRQQEGWEHVDFSTLPMPGPLEEALPKLREQLVAWHPASFEGARRPYLGMGTPSDREWVAKEFAHGKSLGEADFRAIEAMAAPAHRLVEESANRIMDSILEARMRLFDSGDRVVAPFTTQGAPPSSRDGKPGLLQSIGVGWGSWTAGVMILQSDVPGWDAMYAENRALIAERNKLIHEYIRGL